MKTVTGPTGPGFTTRVRLTRADKRISNLIPKTIEKLGVTWTVKRDHVQVFLYVDGRDTGSVAWGLTNWPGFDYESSEITPEDFPPDVAQETLLVRVPVERLDAFVQHVMEMLQHDDVQVYTSAEQALNCANGEVDYASLPQAKALARMVEMVDA